MDGKKMNAMDHGETRKSGQASNPPPNIWMEARHSIDDIDDTFGMIPEFFNSITDHGLPGAWQEIKNLYFNPHTALDLKTKDLIALAVSSQIPCDMWAYFEQLSSLANGGSLQEQSEAVLMASITRHWSTVLNGSLIDKSEFRKEVSQIISHLGDKMDSLKGGLPSEEEFLVHFSSAKEIYTDIEKTFGFLPSFFTMFPDEGIPGAWSEFKGVQLNPHTALRGLQKELIGLAVAAQIPCDYCINFHRSAARLNGATEREIQEAIGMSALVRHWSAIFHGSQLDMERFKREAEQIVEREDFLHWHS